MIPISGLVWFTISLILFVIGFEIRQVSFRRQEENLNLKYFMWFFIWNGIFQLLLSLPHLTLLKANTVHLFPSFMAWAYMDAHIFLYLALAYLASIPFQLYFPKLSKPAFAFVVLGGIVVTILNILFPNTPVFDARTGITLLNASPVVGRAIPVLALIGFAPVALLFLIKGLPSPQRFVKIRSLLLGLGLITIIIGGPLHDYADTVFKAIVADVSSLSGYLIIASGVLYRREEELKESEVSTN